MKTKLLVRNFTVLAVASTFLVLGCGFSQDGAETRLMSEAEDSTAGEILGTADNCLDGQDMAAADVNISRCPPLPTSPRNVSLGRTNVTVRLGLWELGTTGSGQTYKYGSLSSSRRAIRTLSYADGSDVVNQGNLECWAKGYYRLRKILQNPPADYLALRNAGFQGRFFQFQTDLRNGSTGFLEISSYRNHLVKWVTVISRDGSCIQPTLSKFVDYAAGELQRRGL